MVTAFPIALSPSGNPVLTFQSWEETENVSGYDTRRVLISTDGTTFAPIYTSSNNAANWYEVQLDLSAYAGQNIWLRFEFDTGDGLFNNRTGWYIDDVHIAEVGGILNTASVVANEGNSGSDIISTYVIEGGILEYSPSTIEETILLLDTRFLGLGPGFFGIEPGVRLIETLL